MLYAQQWCDTPEDVVQEAFLLLVGSPIRPITRWAGSIESCGIGPSMRCDLGERRVRRETAARGESWFERTEGEGLDSVAATEALIHLPINQRETIVARLWGGLSFKEISALTETPLSSVYRHYDLGLAALRERLGESCSTKRRKTKT